MKLEWDFSELYKFADNLGDISRFDAFCKTAAEDIAKLLKRMLKKNTPVDYGNLRARWDTDNVGVLAMQNSTGFEITLINRTKYAVWVNDGHKQQPGRFIPGYWVGKHFRYDPSVRGYDPKKRKGLVLRKSFVKGRFFVEKSLLQLENGRQIEKIIYKQLQNWWKGL